MYVSFPPEKFILAFCIWFNKAPYQHHQSQSDFNSSQLKCLLQLDLLCKPGFKFWVSWLFKGEKEGLQEYLQTSWPLGWHLQGMAGDISLSFPFPGLILKVGLNVPLLKILDLQSHPCEKLWKLLASAGLREQRESKHLPWHLDGPLLCLNSQRETLMRTVWEHSFLCDGKITYQLAQKTHGSNPTTFPGDSHVWRKEQISWQEGWEGL